MHRDVKPSNILIHENRVILSDFGQARVDMASLYEAAGRDSAGKDTGLWSLSNKNYSENPLNDNLLEDGGSVMRANESV